jgi:hypothetical protein
MLAECFEKGLLTTKDTDGIELRFGNHEAMLKVIELIARYQGIGNRKRWRSFISSKQCYTIRPCDNNSDKKEVTIIR